MREAVSRRFVLTALLLAALIFPAAQASAQAVDVESELVALPEALAAAREALAAEAAARHPRNSIGLSGSIQGDSAARFGLDANAALEYRRAITRALSVGAALPVDVTTGDRRAVRLILEDPDLSIGLRLFAIRANGRPALIVGAAAAYGIRLGDEPNPARVEAALSVPIPTRPWWTVGVSLGRQFRSGGRYATLGLARAF